MTQRIVSQKISRACDGCGLVQEWELIEPSADALDQMQGWYTVIREVFNGSGFAKIMAQACCLACVPVAAVKLALPSVQGEEREIDLASLRQNRSGDPSIN